jgi:aspartyl-tRNA(Asn)/glutamyl-tRNA(Gln) amidotransferase subunit A
MELCDTPALKLAALIKSRQVSAQEAVESSLRRIAAVDGRPGTLEPSDELPDDAERVHAFITLTADAARIRATEIDRRIADGEDPGLLAGVPFTV